MPATCGDVRDSIILEYITNNVPWLPLCSDFTQTSPDPNFSFTSLNSGDFTWAVIRPALTVGLDDVLASYGPFHINSGYRDPFREQAVCEEYHVPYHPDSRHQMGDAVDVASSSKATWTPLAQAACAAGACVEPESYQGNYGHVHMDWRVEDGFVLNGIGQCDPGWGSPK